MTAPKKSKDPSIAQRAASDPAASVWVTASAGTGKTHVLTSRVLRLMLDGATPEQILCITFTKAAASVMTNRIRDELAAWASADDKVLTDKLRKLTGRAPDAARLARARGLFAEFLDAHGDMRIQTIHSFSQSLLRRFPIESGIPPYFDVMDDQTVAETLREAQAEVLQEVGANPNSPLGKAIGVVAPEVSEDDFINLISDITNRRGQLLSLIEENGGLEGTIDAVYGYLGAPKGQTPQQVTAQLASDKGLGGKGPDLEALERAAEILSHSTAAEREKGALLKRWLDNPQERVALLPEYQKIFLTTEGTIRKKLTNDATEHASYALAAEADRLVAGLEAVRTQHVAQSTESLLRMSDAILEKYTARKRALNLLDYDDLVYRASLLMKQDDTAGWVLQKLPGNLKHVLIDEGQDTNPDQWNLVGSIVEEFFRTKGRGSRSKKDNTIFVVGDEKQSIFSFQRAEPAQFAARRKTFADFVRASGGTWRDVQLDVAFRSAPAITQAVDAVFANPAAADGLTWQNEGEEPTPISHDPFRRGQAGLVEVVPIAAPPEKTDPEAWSLPLATETQNDPSVDLAEQIALRIKGWLDSGEKLESRGRAINPADIMILVRRRSDFVDHMVRALKKHGVPVAGADRMSLREQIVVMDLVALGQVLLFPQDEYNLACVLKSPLIGMSDQQLEDLALGRKGNLWDTLAQKAAAGEKVYKDAYDYLVALQGRVGVDRPYELYSSVLMSPCPATGKSGLITIYGRLGYEAEDPLVEYLNALERFEKIHTPDLQGFLAWLAAGEAEVKREVNLSPEHPRVHIMTVHGAKGLEAPIVILPDTIGVPSDNPRTRPRFLWPEGDRKVPLWVPKSDLESAGFKEERAQAELDRDREFRRLLYVAMTRAADRLYVYGERVPDRNFEGSWYNLIQTGLAASPLAVKGEDDTLRVESKQTARPVPDKVQPLDKSRVVGIPAWAHADAPPSRVRTPKFRPSQAIVKKTAANNNAFTATAPSPLDRKAPEGYYAELGTAVHALFEFLPHLPQEDRAEAARAYLAQPALGIRKKDQEAGLRNVAKVLNDPSFAPIFGPGSRAEVAVNGYIEKDGQKQALSAKIDRLVVTEKEVLIVDFKNNFHVPEGAADAPPEYTAQLAAYKLALEQIYPQKKVKCALLYTRAAKLIELPEAQLNGALRSLKLTPYAPAAAAPKP